MEPELHDYPVVYEPELGASLASPFGSDFGGWQHKSLLRRPQV